MTRYTPITGNDLKIQLKVPIPHINPSDQAIPKRNEVLYRVGVDGIILNYTNAHEIQQKYGMAYDVYDINGYSIEMKYFGIGLSCFFHQSDLEKKIFSVRMWKEFKAFQKLEASISSDIKPYLILHDVFVHEMGEEEAIKNYDETYYVNYAFFRYNFIPDISCSEDLFRIESITLMGDGF